MHSDERKSPPILVSGCLAGLACRYNGTAAPVEAVLELVRQGRAIPVCPEQLGGCPTPRPPHEIRNGRIVGIDGTDNTDAFARGAEEALKLAKLAGCTKAVLKARSPSCGSGIVYDGTFSNRTIEGTGLFADLLIKHGFEVISDDKIQNFTHI